MARDDIEKMIVTFEGAIRSRPDYASRLVGLAGVLAEKGHPVHALELCRKAVALAPADPELAVRARRVTDRLAPRYHLPMMLDARRNDAWDQALRRAIRPGTYVLEIGSGAGMLALMAARAGARVVTCERHAVMAHVAREIVATNGFSDRITVVAKRAQDLEVGVDLERPADLLITDIFSNTLLGYEPLAVLADARKRLLSPTAAVMPGAGAIRMALASWKEWGHFPAITHGFDLSPMAAFIPESVLMTPDTSAAALLSREADAFCFDFASGANPPPERRTVRMEATTDGVVNGIVQWTRLELDFEAALDSRPGQDPPYFLRPVFRPLPSALSVRQGQAVAIAVEHDGRNLTMWIPRADP